MTKVVWTLLILLLSLQLSFADVGYRQQVRDIYVDGQNELIGSMTLYIDNNDFPNASEKPIYIQIHLSKNVRLSQTVVDPLLHRKPINLHTYVPDNPYTEETVENAMLPDDIQLIRAIAGENKIWLRVNRSSHNWLDTDHDGVGDAPPSPVHPITFRIGVEAGVGNVMDTRLWLDVDNNNCADFEVNDLFGFNARLMIAVVPPGTYGLPETAPNEYYDPKTCTYVEQINKNFVQQYRPSFAVEYHLGYGVNQPAVGVEIFADETVIAGDVIRLTGNLSGHADNALVYWNFGDDEKRAIDAGNVVDHTFLNPGVYDVLATVSNSQGYTDTALKTINVISPAMLSGPTVLAPHLAPAHSGYQTELTIENNSSSPQNFKILAYDTYGESLDAYNFSINAADGIPRIKRINLSKLLDSNATHCTVTGHIGVSTTFVPTTRNGTIVQARIPSKSAKKWLLHCGNWNQVWDALAIVNTASETAILSYQHHTSDGRLLDRQDHQNLAGRAKNYQVFDGSSFQNHRGGFIIIESNQPIQILALRGTKTLRGPSIIWDTPVIPIND